MTGRVVECPIDEMNKPRGADDEYDTLEYGDKTAAQVDAEVTAEARRLAAHL